MGTYARLSIQNIIQVSSVRREQSSDKEYIRTGQYTKYNASTNVYQEQDSQF